VETEERNSCECTLTSLDLATGHDSKSAGRLVTRLHATMFGYICPGLPIRCAANVANHYLFSSTDRLKLIIPRTNEEKDGDEKTKSLSRTPASR
jgi:hypothetical protein